MGEFGFDRVIYGMTRVAGTDGSLGDLDDALILSNHGPAYDAAFINSGLFLESPGFQWARANTGAIGWGALWAGSSTHSDRARDFIGFQRSRNVRAGYTVSIEPSTARTFAAISLTGRADLAQADLDALWAEKGCQIWAMSNVMHLKILTLPHRGYVQELSARQREALEWVGDGKSYHDIATIMGVSVATVEKHLRLAREKLRVTTTSQAVLKASVQNRIYTSGPGLFHRSRRPGRVVDPCDRPADPVS